MRAADSDRHMGVVMAALAERDRRSLQQLLGWYMTTR
jgi:hypothetical protein